MCRIVIAVVAVGLLIASARAQPREWVDDFTAASTYDSASLLAPCYGGPPTKYTLFEGFSADIFNERAVSGGGSYTFTNKNSFMTPSIGRKEFAMIGWMGFNIGCPGEPPLFTTNEPFTSDDICAYGGMTFSPWQTKLAPGNDWTITGPDGQPGVAGVDDDLDGTTDEIDEAIMARPTTVNSGYGNKDGTGFAAGVDAAPGIAGVDDDGNGITDDYGECGWAGSDDGDDTTRPIFWLSMNADIPRSEDIHFAMDSTSTANGFSVMEIRNLSIPHIEDSNEIAYGFFQPNTHYNWVVCASGTCHGGVLWTENDMANPNETIGPAINTYHTGATANQVAMAYDVYGGAAGESPHVFVRQMDFVVNKNFSDTFWVISGPATMTDFTNGVFGYPSPSADLDNDRDVDVNDFLTFSGCFAGSLVPPAGGCQNTQADLDGDGDVDVNDFLTFSSCFNGSLKRPNDACFPPDLMTGTWLNCGA